jgi:hypothetical protein
LEPFIGAHQGYMQNKPCLGYVFYRLNDVSEEVVSAVQ